MVALIILSRLLLPSALAGDNNSRAPVRCDAVWIGPSTGCDLAGTWASTGLGRDEEDARDAAAERLWSAMQAGSDALALRYQAANANDPGGGPKRDGCQTDLNARIRFSCLAEPELRENRLCFADLDEPDCWTADPLLLEGSVWREMERGRDQVCRQMEAELRASNVSAQQLATCRARCYQAARVRCPSGLIEEQWDGDRPHLLTDEIHDR